MLDEVSVMGFAVFHKAVCDVVDFQQLLIIFFLYVGVDCPGDHLHPPLVPVLDIIPATDTLMVRNHLSCQSLTSKTDLKARDSQGDKVLLYEEG